MLDKSRLAFVLLVSIFGFLDITNADQEKLRAEHNHSRPSTAPPPEIVTRKPFELYTGKKVTCADASDDESGEDYSCCAVLDGCAEVIPPGSTKYGIENSMSDNMHRCDCSDEFRRCLLAANQRNPSAHYEMLGRTYFDTEPRRKCFQRIQNMSCLGPYYDAHGNLHSENPRGYFFCVKASNTQQYHYIPQSP